MVNEYMSRWEGLPIVYIRIMAGGVRFLEDVNWWGRSKLEEAVFLNHELARAWAGTGSGRFWSREHEMSRYEGLDGPVAVLAHGACQTYPGRFPVSQFSFSQGLQGFWRSVTL